MSALPVLGFAAFSGTGKTTLLVQVIPLLRSAGVRVGLIKHAHHAFDIDKPGKDSYELRKAGAGQVLIASSQRRALLTENAQAGDPRLADLIGELHQQDLDLILVEGFKHERFAKIELHRAAVAKPWLYPEDDAIIAIACDGPVPITTSLPILDINDAAAIAQFILQRFIQT